MKINAGKCNNSLSTLKNWEWSPTSVLALMSGWWGSQSKVVKKRTGYFHKAGISEAITPETVQYPGRDLRMSVRSVLSFE